MTKIAILALAMQCAPQVAPETIWRIITVEAAYTSAGEPNPYSLNINGAVLSRQPRNHHEATHTAKYFVNQNYSVDIGLMQVNSQHLERFNLTINSLFDPCTNIRIGGQILTEFYRRAPAGNRPEMRLLHALSAYNTGNFFAGLHNGYVARYFNVK